MTSAPHLFEQIINASGVAMAVRLPDLCPILTNQAFLDYYGYGKNEIGILPPEAVLPDTTLALYETDILPTLQSGKSWDGEFAIRTKLGEHLTVWGRFDPVFDGSGQLSHIVSVMHDAVNSEDLNACNASLKFISDATSDIFFRLRLPDGKFDYLSSSVERFFGYTLKEHKLEPLLFKRIVHPDWREYFDEMWEELNNGIIRPDYELQYVHKSGDVRWVNQRLVLHRDAMGTPVAVEGIATDITARKIAEQALRANEEKFRFLTENITDVIWTLDLDLNFTYTTPSVKEVWGYDSEEVTKIHLFDFIVPESIPIFEDAVKKRAQVESEGNFDFVNRMELEHFRGDGSRFWMETVVKRIFDRDGKPCGYQGLSRDITKSKQAQAELAKRETRYRTLFEDSPISLWEEDLSDLKQYFEELKAQGITDFREYFYNHPESLNTCASLIKVVDVNKATLDLLAARSKEQLFGNLDKILTESSMAAFTEEIIMLASGGYEYCGEITNRTLNGETIWVMVHFFVPDEYKKCLSRVIVSLLDVTPRKRAEQALMDSEERYRVLAENSQEGVAVTQHGLTKYINESMSSILGYTTDELKQIHPIELAHPEDKAMALGQMGTYVTGKRKDAFASFRVITKNKEIKWLTLNVKPISWGGKDAQIEILTDVTRHKKLEAELLAAHAQMEDRINKRTAELSKANAQLKAEADERSKAQERITSLTKQLILVQEDERQRISRDLHDNVAQDLSSIMLKMETLFDDVDNVDPRLEERGESMAQVLRKAIASVRDIAYGLRPPALDQLGLVKALDNLCQDSGSKYGFSVDFFSIGIETVTLDFDTEINIYRMVQEAVRNIGKHAEANKITVRLVKSHPDILIRIEDNGKGFIPKERMTEADAEKRMGMRSMEERARLIGGTMEIQSRIGTGTRILFKVPIENARRHD
ncbi:PAS domain-containing sensor histidine kinase [Pseudodesulfovibrio sediminis]|nr:PAS domain S-box protein [Pseudodesulfovibrio sediminis]